VLGKREVRRALAFALDRRALAEGLFRGTVETTETLVPPGHWARDDGLPPLARDLDRARALLDAAGYPDPGGGRPRLSLSYKTSTDDVGILQATAIAEQWKAIGVATAIRSNDFATFYQDVVRGNFQLFALRWQGIVDADHYHEVFLSTAVPREAGTAASSPTPTSTAGSRTPGTSSTGPLRRDFYVKIQRRVAEELPYVSLYTMKTGRRPRERS